MRSGAGGRRSRCASVLVSGRPPPLSLRQHQRVVVLGDGDHLVVVGERGLHRWIEQHFTVAAHDSHDRGILVGRDHLAIGAAGERGFRLEVDLGAVEIEQLGVDHRQSRLAAGLGGHPCDEVLALHVDGLLAAHQRRRLEIPRIADLRDDVIRLLLAVRVVGDRQHRLDDVDVGILGFRRQHDDGTRRVRVDHGQVVEVERIAAAADDARVLRARGISRGCRLPSRPCRVRTGSRCTGFFWFSLAISSSPMMEYTLLDQPRISVKPSSMTRERPLRISVSRDSRPEVMVPIRMLTMKMPPMVTISISSRSCQPASPATTPGSRVRSMLCHMPSKKP